MTKDDIIELAREAGFDPHDMSDDFTCNLKDIGRFAELHQGLFFDAVYEAWHSAGMDVLGGDWNTFASTLETKLKEKNK